MVTAAISKLAKVEPPRLPDATIAYVPAYQDQLNNIQRLYYNRLSGNMNNLVGESGGRFLQFPYAAVQRTTDLNFAAANTATQVTFNVNDYLNATANDGTDGIEVTYSGIYNYQFSVQFANTDSQIHTAYLWLRVNGVDLAGTGSKFDVPNKHGSSDGYLIATCNFYVSLNAGDTVELWGAGSQVENGVTDGIYMEAYAAQTTPFAMPSIPSAVATLSFVSSLPGA